MIIREPSNSKDAKHYTTERLRDEFLIQDLFIPGKIKRVYSHIDRIITMGYCPLEKQELGEELDIMANLGTDYFLERRELGVINVGGKGMITVDGKTYTMNPEDGLYVGQGAKEVYFESADQNDPAKFYTLSAPAHCHYDDKHIDITKAKQVPLGDPSLANQRTIYQFLHPEVLETCQLSMGLTKMNEGNVWNTMPCHTHERRMEVYFYYNLSENDLVFHMMGQPNETRHIIMRNEEAVISPSWSIHSGCGNKAYNFIWGMVGENKTFNDMDHIDMKDLR
ncbi:5-dehydro-4-deoxy-D-glucuronate isomerase [Acidaminobacter sp. JC074]|uniref:5-dehydro-4-deoxy-D-glucuronate isomerase n=1 Tax=Acidaminobacter sp. JC074 TaxID=2530199 RepID=UPI001F100BFF|nr:5-dehydro-4-deoxy-D-glucuronate isomerase [Acidaminobacter sp. JC074]MCH4886994.1 5-dehydro-4-deoxy-D-glucuronate isomerase [Acidaminobacter sp. JC074]